MKGKKSILSALKQDKLIKNEAVLKAFDKVKREDFLPDYLKNLAYSDAPLPINESESMNSITTTLFFIDLLEPKEGQTIYEIGAGTGYSTALLSEIVGKKGKIISFEINKEIYGKAKKNLKKHSNIDLVLGNGLKGFPDFAPYDSIIIFGSLDEEPKNLLNYLKVGGKLIYPHGKILQKLIRITRMEKGAKKEEFGEYRLSKMIK
jgi:protein-L-isoaspartate(D-aspartate) O-methyltransferase